MYCHTGDLVFFVNVSFIHSVYNYRANDGWATVGDGNPQARAPLMKARRSEDSDCPDMGRVAEGAPELGGVCRDFWR